MAPNRPNRPKRPRDPNQLAKAIVDIASGQNDSYPVPGVDTEPNSASEFGNH